jgi:hypothetical protein
MIASDTWRWGNEMLSVLDELERSLVGISPSLIDREVIPGFDGSPDEMAVWLICQNAAEVPKLQPQRETLRRALVERMRAHNFPEMACQTVWLGFVSREEIDHGGGRFQYFR